MQKKAFTLIELLVVIAIIAILAAILFPVFASAKASAKSSASLSNLKQNMTAALLYSGDYDDTFSPSQTWNNYIYIGGYASVRGGKGFNTWRTLIYPYTKNVDLYNDPIAPAHYLNAGFAVAPQLNKTLYTQYGLNHMFMGPIQNNGGAAYDKVGISATAPANPASTVYFVQQYAVFVDSAYNWSGNTTTEWAYYGLIDAPDCYGTPATLVCIDNWGKGSAWEASLLLPQTAGGRSGGVATRNANQVITAFVDGHARKMTLGALAAGTNWSPDQASSGVGVVVANEDKYMWDLK